MIDTRPINKKTLNILNLIGEKLLDLNLPLAQLDESLLYQGAVKSTGLEDFGDDYHREGVRQLLASGRQDARFHFFGQLGYTVTISMNLVNRLRLIEEKKRAAEIFQQPVKEPIFILGLPRSGTTFLHRLLDLDRGLIAPQFWELLHPIPEGSPDRRFQKTKREISIGMLFYQGRDHIHFSRAHTPEECVVLLAPTFFSQFYWTYAPIYAYLEWFMEQDRVIPYREYKWYLQVLQHAHPDQHLLMKAPAHLGSLDQIMKFFPDARIIQTHRHPVPVINSINSLNYSTHVRVTNTYDVLKTAEYTTQLWLKETHRNLEARRENHGKIFDLYYRDFIADPLGMIRRIYNHFNLPWAEDYDDVLRDAIANNLQDKFGRHYYKSEDFGTTDQAIFNKFQAYCEAFGYTDRKVTAQQ
jgi:hypothetical protein